MGLPLPNGKLAMWMFLVTEIMFFTALIGVYMILRTRPDPPRSAGRRRTKSISSRNWRHQHLRADLLQPHGRAGPLGAAGNVKQTTIFVAVTLALGVVFLGIKAVSTRRNGTTHPARPDRRKAPDMPAAQRDFHNTRTHYEDPVKGDEVAAAVACQQLLDDMALRARRPHGAPPRRGDAAGRRTQREVQAGPVARHASKDVKEGLEKEVKKHEVAADCQHVLDMMGGKELVLARDDKEGNRRRRGYKPVADHKG